MLSSQPVWIGNTLKDVKRLNIKGNIRGCSSICFTWHISLKCSFLHSPQKRRNLRDWNKCIWQIDKTRTKRENMCFCLGWTAPLKKEHKEAQLVTHRWMMDGLMDTTTSWWSPAQAAPAAHRTTMHGSPPGHAPLWCTQPCRLHLHMHSKHHCWQEPQQPPLCSTAVSTFVFRIWKLQYFISGKQQLTRRPPPSSCFEWTQRWTSSPSQITPSVPWPAAL